MLVLTALVILNFTVNTGNTLVQNKEKSGNAGYHFSAIQGIALSETESEKDASDERKSKPGTGQILKDIKKLNRKNRISDFNKRYKAD